MVGDNIVVVGIFVVDVAFSASKLPLPGETIIGENYIIGPGGKGSNQSVAISRLGGKASIIARIGDDQFGNIGIQLYKEENINSSGLVIAKGEKTGSATISIDKEGMNSIIVVPGAASGLNKSMIDKNINLINDASIMLTGFEIPLDVVSYCLMLAKSKNIKTILNPAPYFDSDLSIYNLVDYLTPNEHEASYLTKIKVKTIDDARVAGKKLCELGVGTSIITMGEKGVYCTIGKNHEGFHLPSYKLKNRVVDTVGAGDVFNGAFATAISENMGLEDALEFANKAAAISVTKKGAALSAPYRDQVLS